VNINDISLGILFFLLFILFLLSAFFSGSETALMALNRYKLKHHAKKNKGAQLAINLLQKPDRLIGLILLGNNLVNILITQLATLIGFRLGGNAGIAIATGVLTLMLLIFAEVTPKTIAALKAEKIAFPSAYVYTPLLTIAYPLVWLINQVANIIVRMVGVDPENNDIQALNHEELKAVVNEASGLIPSSHQEMLLRVLDMETTTVEDIMIPRTEISGIDLNDDWNDIEEQLLRCNFTRLLVYKGNLNDIQGFIHLRRLLPLFHEKELERHHLEKALRPAYYTPEGVPLTQQLINFQKEKRRLALVVDEYGEIQGLVTLQDLLEEIVGEFSTSLTHSDFEAIRKEDGSIWLDGSMHIRDINRQLNMDLPTDGPKTINGLLLEHLQSIPAPGTTSLINDYPMEVRKTRNNAIKTLIIYPKIVNKNKTETNGKN